MTIEDYIKQYSLQVTQIPGGRWAVTGHGMGVNACSLDQAVHSWIEVSGMVQTLTESAVKKDAFIRKLQHAGDDLAGEVKFNVKDSPTAKNFLEAWEALK